MKMFIIQTDDPSIEVEYIIDGDAPINDILEELRKFLKVSGYKVDGFLDIIEYDDWK